MPPDYLIFGKNSDFEATWKMVQNCSEADKMRLLLRLYSYFTKGKEPKYLEKNVLNEIDEISSKIMD